MAIIKKTVVDFSDIFQFAKKKHNIEWNTCCDIFHRNPILVCDEGRNKEFDLEEFENEYKYCLENPGKYFTESDKIGYPIVIEFMKENNLTEMYVENN